MSELMNGNGRIRVLVVDDHPLMRGALQALLSEEEDFEVVGEAGTGNAALTLALELQPDIVLLDLFLGNFNGLDIVKQLQRGCPQTHIVVFTGFSREELLLDAIRVGVHGDLPKTLSHPELLSALRAVEQGERVIGETRAITQVLNEFNRLAQERNLARYGLSAKEIEIMRLASYGYSNKEIGSHIFWSEITVKRKMQDIYRKLQVSDRTQAVAEAMRLGLI
jgi:DNA-binding NarL/FixJ family response regulator